MSTETIVLVHGLWMNSAEMALLSRRMRKYGYKTERFSYNSLQKTPQQNAAALAEFVRQLQTPVVHFICHSLGGIVVRHLFNDFPAQRPGRIVTLGTPHNASFCAHRLVRVLPGRILLGKSITNGLLGNIPPWQQTHELGSIAGTLGWGLGRLLLRMPAPNDGVVAVEETRFEGMRDHATVKASHIGLLLSSRAAGLCNTFIQNGTFGNGSV